MKPPRFIRTTSFRLTALYAGLFAASAAVLFGIVYWVTGGVLHEQVRLSLQSEMASLEAEGSGDFPAEVKVRLASPSSQPFYYSLQESDQDARSQEIWRHSTLSKDGASFQIQPNLVQPRLPKKATTTFWPSGVGCLAEAS